GEAPAGRGPGGRLRVGDFVEADLARAGDGEEAFLGGVIAPELGVDRVGDDAGGDLVVLGRREDAGFAELAWERRLRLRVGSLDQLVDAAAGEIEEIQLALGVFTPAHDAVGGAGDFGMSHGQNPGACLYLQNPVVLFPPNDRRGPGAKGPYPARVKIAVNVIARQILEALATINEAARQRTEVRVWVLDDRF